MCSVIGSVRCGACVQERFAHAYINVYIRGGCSSLWPQNLNYPERTHTQAHTHTGTQTHTVPYKTWYAMVAGARIHETLTKWPWARNE